MAERIDSIGFQGIALDTEYILAHPRQHEGRRSLSWNAVKISMKAVSLVLASALVCVADASQAMCESS